jgi:hypothetical protein
MAHSGHGPIPQLPNCQNSQPWFNSSLTVHDILLFVSVLISFHGKSLALYKKMLSLIHFYLVTGSTAFFSLLNFSVIVNFSVICWPKLSAT